VLRGFHDVKMKYRIGDKINGIKLISRLRKGTTAMGTFLCPYCGEKFESRIKYVVSGKTRSCGCRTSEWISESETTHGLSKHKVYLVWQAMKQRCLNPNSSHYSDYGARGISIFPEWAEDFKAFFDYVTQLPSYPGEENLGKCKGCLTLDRINNDGNYEPGNLRWATAAEQRANQR